MKRLLSLMLMMALPGVALGQSDGPELETILQRVRARVTQHYLDLKSLAWSDTAKSEVLKGDQTPKEKPRTLVYDAIIRLQEPASDDHGIPFYIRPAGELLTIDGKPAKKNEKPKPTDPQVGSPGSLLFLLLTDSRADRYGFSYGGITELDGRKALRIGLTMAQIAPPRVTWNDSFVFFGFRYGFQVSGVHWNKGSIWVDPETYDVLQSEWSSDPFEFQRNLPMRGSQKIRFEQGMKARFEPMTFAGPEQTLVVPVSFENTTTITREDGVTIYRGTHGFTDYKRFTGDAKVIASEGPAK